ncbi:MAG: hypothetical protein KKD64_07015 [Alphaproteobacteria bacterium]|nr:hypothetical protein [Alphaproteobacteria bacterium]MBU0795244.1 hypothetical protein [Alphaproteobacteria bacterium]MBU0876686.1 hypothetical protein [Alphaproteobacteria bacterium]MBU1769388.1 hypothetical protein [Alphaproteobacteria bacterium]
MIFVLPAELGIDPTGLGKQSGLTEMANPQAGEALERGRKRTGVLTPSQTAPAAEPGASDHWTYVLGPYEEVELKYTLDKGGAIAFAWRADGSLNYDMHAHPFEGGEALTESYAVAKGDSQSGRYVAAFSGIHGWHWQNRSVSPVTLTLNTSGQIKGSMLMDGRQEQDRALSPTASSTP